MFVSDLSLSLSSFAYFIWNCRRFYSIVDIPIFYCRLRGSRCNVVILSLTRLASNNNRNLYGVSLHTL